MKFTIEAPVLLKALQRVQGIVEKKTTMPVLANVLLQSDGQDSLRVTATNLEIVLTANYPANIEQEGAICLSGKSLYDIVRGLVGTVSLHRLENNWVEIASGRTHYRLVGMNPSVFPTPPRPESKVQFPIARTLFREMIDKTLYAVSLDDSRHNLTGIFCTPLEQGPGLRMVATDGHRLALIDRPLRTAPPLKRGVTIPRKGVIELRRMIEEQGPEATLSFAENSVTLEDGGLSLTIQLLDGQFADYQKVIPTSFLAVAIVPRLQMLEALKRTSLFSPDKMQSIRLDFSAGIVLISANNPDLGEATEEIPCEFNAEPLKVTLNHRFLTDALSAIETEKAEIRLNDPYSLPLVVYPVGQEGYRALVMPMRP